MNELERLQEENNRLRDERERFRLALIEMLALCPFDNNPVIPIEYYRLVDPHKWYERVKELSVVRSLN